jgi:hypothetical protein
VWQRAARAQALSQNISRESLDNRVGHEDGSISRSKGPQQLLIIDYEPACLDSVGDVVTFSENNMVAQTGLGRQTCSPLSHSKGLAMAP